MATLQRIGSEELKEVIVELEHDLKQKEHELKQALSEKKSLGKRTLFNRQTKKRHELKNKIGQLENDIPRIEQSIRLAKIRLGKPKKSPTQTVKKTPTPKKGLLASYLTMFEGGRNRRTQRKNV
jgi:septal ring factor EnvC (AmiA/AmiB activator)